MKLQHKEIALLKQITIKIQHESEVQKRVISELHEVIEQNVEIKRGYIDSVNNRVENLNFEFGKMACLPLNNPYRQALVDEVSVAIKHIQKKLDPVLFPGHEPLGDLDWMYKLKSKEFPYSLTDEEGIILYKLITDTGMRNGYEIATAFGYSSFYLGLAFKKNGGRLLSMDAYVEETEENFIYDIATAQKRSEIFDSHRRNGELEKLPEGLKFALHGSKELGIEEVVRYEIGFSPTDVPNLLKGETIDFAFIDGGHFGVQPCLDVEAVIPFMSGEKCIMVFHDVQCEAVAKGVFHAAERIGGNIHSINTRNRLVVVSRNIDSRVIQECREIIARQYK
jgi:predicted O-methyltransferase YrrM